MTRRGERNVYYFKNKQFVHRICEELRSRAMLLRALAGGAGVLAAVVLVCIDMSMQSTGSVEALGEPLTRSEPG